MNKLLSILEGIYIYYMYNFFKTKYSFNFPYEINWNLNFLKHSKMDKYQSKICPLGNLVGILLLLWFCFRFYINRYKYYNKYIIYMIIIGSLFMNFNAFIYFIPIIIIEFYYSI